MKNVKIYDNGGKTYDRYVAIYLNRPEGPLFEARAMSEFPFHPQGFGLYTTAEPGKHLGKRIKFEELPKDCQKLVLQDLE